MFYAPFDSVVGTPQISIVQVVDNVQRVGTGELITAQDNYWGTGEFIYGYAVGPMIAGSVCYYSPTLQPTGVRTEMGAFTAASANTGRSLCVAMATMAVGQFGWFAVTGTLPIAGNAAVAVGTPFGTTTLGRIGTLTAGKQVLNATISADSTTTVVKTGVTGVTGQTIINIPNGEGWFVGIYLSGTGIGAGSQVVSITPDQKQAVVSVANSASVTGSVTGTYNNATVFYHLVTFSRPFQQGAIT